MNQWLFGCVAVVALVAFATALTWRRPVDDVQAILDSLGNFIVKVLHFWRS